MSSKLAAVAIDGEGRPWFALFGEDEALRVGHVAGSDIVLESVPGFRTSTSLALGFAAKEVIVARVAARLPVAPPGHDPPQVARRDSEGRWTVSDVQSPCVDRPEEMLSPVVAIDGGGRVVHGCLEPRRPKVRARRDFEMPAPAPQPTSVTLRVGTVDANGWQPLLRRRVPVTSYALELERGPQGEILVVVSSADDPVQLTVDAQGKASAQATARPEFSEPTPERFSTTGARHIASFCGPRREHVAGGLCRGVLALSDERGSWHPLVGSWPRGISGGARPATRPAIALDAHDDPVVAWSEDGRVRILRWDGGAWVSVAVLDIETLQGLTVDDDGKIWVITLSQAPGRIKWEVFKVDQGHVEAITPLEFAGDGGETRRSFEQARLSARPELAVTFPDANPPARWVFEPQRRDWIRHDVELPPAPTPPWSPRPGRFFEHTTIQQTGQHVGQAFTVWAEEQTLEVARWDGQRWTTLDELPRAILRGQPAIAAGAGRVCIAWSNESFQPTVFVRCHAMSS